MQTTKRATGLRTAAADYETLVQQASNKVTGFEQLYKELQRARFHTVIDRVNVIKWICLVQSQY